MNNQNINLLSEQFKQKILNTINQAQLPASLVYYILKDIFNSLEIGYFNSLNTISKEQKQQ